ncbi:hypothetical protein N9H39_09005 [Gammaproteobacteria bacterium]|nr:hypothetical protein [Gammaproteobacteria bacterium]
MRNSIICIPMLAMTIVMAGPASGLTLYKCVLLDGGGIIYQANEPSESECVVEKKDLDPNANVIRPWISSADGSPRP